MHHRIRYIRGSVGTAVLGMLLAATTAFAQPIKVGEINSYSSLPQFTVPYRNGWNLALDEINAAGGVLGRRIEVISRDDAGKPGDALTAANELVSREQVHLLMGTFFSHVGLAVSDFARQKRVLFLAAEPLSTAVTWSRHNRYTFRLRPNVHTQAAMLADAAAELGAQRWATVAPNYEYGHSAVDWFQALLKERQPSVKWVGEQWPPLFKIEAGSTVQALAQSDPEAIYNVTFGPDLSKFIREGRTRGLFEGRKVVSLLTGEPEYLDPLQDEAPEGWIVTGYPWYAIDTPAHNAFLKAYQERFDEHPRLGSVVGYAAMKSVAAIVRKAGSTDTDAMIRAAEGVTVQTPFGEIAYRPQDHQSTMGAYVGRTTVRDGKGVMVDWHYADGADYLPTGEALERLMAGE